MIARFRESSFILPVLATVLQPFLQFVDSDTSVIERQLVGAVPVQALHPPSAGRRSILLLCSPPPCEDPKAPAGPPACPVSSALNATHFPADAIRAGAAALDPFLAAPCGQPAITPSSSTGGSSIAAHTVMHLDSPLPAAITAPRATAKPTVGCKHHRYLLHCCICVPGK